MTERMSTFFPSEFTGIAQWIICTIYILSNEKYDGDTLFQKYYGEETVPFKKHRNYGEMDQFFARNTHDAILPLPCSAFVK